MRKVLRGHLEGHAGDLVVLRLGGRPYSLEQIGKMFRRASRGGRLKDFHLHDLRHPGATMALSKGSAPIVIALDGWKTERMMRRYAAVSDTTLPAAAAVASRGGGPCLVRRARCLLLEDRIVSILASLLMALHAIGKGCSNRRSIKARK